MCVSVFCIVVAITIATAWRYLVIVSQAEIILL